MLDTIDARVLSWAPDWLLALAMIVAAVIGALAAHYAFRRLVGQFLVRRHPIVLPFFSRTRDIVRYALILFALSLVMPAVPLDPTATDIAHKVFIAAVVLLVGWAVLLAVNMTADHYMGFFRLDTDDNLLARKAITQVRVLKRILDILIVMIALGFALMTFDTVRELGVSLFASAGVAGLVAGLAARPIFANIFAGLQLAMTQPIRIDDIVVVENEFGRIEEFSSSYVVIKLWDLRRMVVPLSYFMERPFQNWTRSSSQVLGSVLLYVDYAAPVSLIREKAIEIVKQSKFWDGQVVNLQVTDAKENTIELRVLVSAANADNAWNLRVDVREKLIAFLQTECPQALPRRRTETLITHESGADGKDNAARDSAH